MQFHVASLQCLRTHDDALGQPVKETMLCKETYATKLSRIIRLD